MGLSKHDRSLLHCVVLLLLCGCSAIGRTQTKDSADELESSTEAVAPLRYVAAHGQRALVDGYASEGLEVWAYPFQVLANYRLSFLVEGTTTPLDGAGLLRRVVVTPEAVTRIYLGPEFVVRETVFVPLDKAGAIITYSVESSHAVEIEVHASPVMNLMWPAGVGGQSVDWIGGMFVLREPTTGFSATIGSPQMSSHDDLSNRTTGGVGDTGLGFTLRPDGDGVARLYILLNDPKADVKAGVAELERDREKLISAYAEHVKELRASDVVVKTPDAAVNEAIAWSEVALDEAWVCNPQLGCGYVAGYGPSRGARRPQYDWFFAGDGLIAADAAIRAGDVSHARDELAFILKYQDKKTGMIWHELSQSAGFIDWVGKYPYMYVHVDITFQFLSMLSRYVEETGDVKFLQEHWDDIERAYGYCASLIDAGTGLPRIPANKEGGDEQDRMSEDLGLSASWVAAASGFERLAELTGHTNMAKQAAAASERARVEIRKRYWDEKAEFWINGFTESGKVMEEQRSSPSEALTLHLFSPAEEEAMLDQIGSSRFQTDWGSRGIGTGSKGFDPTSYAKGSVSALGTANLAEAFWGEHRPAQAQGMWESLLPWFSLNAVGHMDEVLAGNLYREQGESVPEQTWSSAGFVSATMHGLLGLDVDALDKRVEFAPRLPTNWNDVSIQGVKVGDGVVSFALHKSAGQLKLTVENSGTPLQIEFAPVVALGAQPGVAAVNGHEVQVSAENHPQETTAKVMFEAGRGETTVEVAVKGGVSIIPPSAIPVLGEPSQGAKLVDVRLEEDRLTVIADVPAGVVSKMEVDTDWGLDGPGIETVGPSVKEIEFDATKTGGQAGAYQRMQLSFQVMR